MRLKSIGLALSLLIFAADLAHPAGSSETAEQPPETVPRVAQSSEGRRVEIKRLPFLILLESSICFRKPSMSSDPPRHGILVPSPPASVYYGEVKDVQLYDGFLEVLPLINLYSGRRSWSSKPYNQVDLVLVQSTNGIQVTEEHMENIKVSRPKTKLKYVFKWALPTDTEWRVKLEAKGQEPPEVHKGNDRFQKFLEEVSTTFGDSLYFKDMLLFGNTDELLDAAFAKGIFTHKVGMENEHGLTGTDFEAGILYWQGRTPRLQKHLDRVRKPLPPADDRLVGVMGGSPISDGHKGETSSGKDSWSDTDDESNQSQRRRKGTRRASASPQRSSKDMRGAREDSGKPRGHTRRLSDGFRYPIEGLPQTPTTKKGRWPWSSKDSSMDS